MTALTGFAREGAEDFGHLPVDGGPVPGTATSVETTLWGTAAEPADRRFFPAEGEFLAPDEVVVTFDRGVPVAIDGETVSVAEARGMLSARGEAQGIGRDDPVVAPGALALVTAYRALERVTPERPGRQAGRGCASLVGAVTGEVRLVLYDGRVTVAGLRPTNEHTEEKREQ
ncbi:hypothetical protein ABJI51_38780 [Amycolatopsis sp. NEAU-NG30]|uniref:Arginosuccinate synthase C-terminal domain-containing protein n=1 Tax=Amycolatopsis melonis TaxID=3156488 RepID=A0ABV0LSD4_9PSEU